MDAQKYNHWLDNKDRILAEHARQIMLAQQGKLRQMYSLSATELGSLIKRDSNELHGEDCVFLWAVGVRADDDIPHPRAT